METLPSYFLIGQLTPSQLQVGLPWWLSGKESACNAGATEDIGSIPGSERSPGEGHGNITPVFLPGASHGQRSLMGYGPKGHTEFNIIKRLSTHALQVWLTSTE